jgi:phosphate acetyltransferase
MDILTKLHQKTKGLRKRVCLPEAVEDSRVMEAAGIFRAKDLGIPLLIGSTDRLQESASKANVSLNDMVCIDIHQYDRFDEMVAIYLQQRLKDGLSEEEVRQLLLDPVYFGAMLVKLGVADGMTTGATHSSPHVIKAAIKCIGPKKGIKTVSSTFMMILPENVPVKNRVLFYSDAALIPQPNVEQLVDIGEMTAETCWQLQGVEPVIAYLSFSTKGSTDRPETRKMAEAAIILASRRSDLKVDGELQFDAAMVERVAKIKCPMSEIAGNANVLIFPGLDAGNIAYKITECLAGARAIGMITQGLSLPVNDLSRGCSAGDIVDLAAITVLQSLSCSS